MQKIILITGSTDGIGLETARMLVTQGHRVLLHGRNPAKLAEVEKSLSTLPGGGSIESYLADLSRMAEVETLARTVSERHTRLDVLINNAGIFKTPEPITQDGLDVRFAVNSIAPYLLTQRLLSLLGASARVINLSSAAQAPVDLKALGGQSRLTDDFNAYAQSKLAITAWSRSMALLLGKKGPAIIALNPGSLLATKMVREGFGLAGNDIRTGAEILIRAALSEEFAAASGQYFDNDSDHFAPPHAEALDPHKASQIVHTIERILAELMPSSESIP